MVWSIFIDVSTHFLEQIPPSAWPFTPSSSHLRLRDIVIMVVTSLFWLADSLIWKCLQVGSWPFGIVPSNLNQRDSFITHVSSSGSLLFRFQSFFVSCPNFVLQLAISFSGSFLYYLGLELATCYFVFRLFLYLPPTFFCFFLAVKITYCKKCLVFTTVVSEKMLMGPIESSPMTKGVWCHAQNLFGNILRTYLRV